MDGFDLDRVSAALARALTGPGGVALALNVFAGVPGVVQAAREFGKNRGLKLAEMHDEVHKLTSALPKAEPIDCPGLAVIREPLVTVAHFSDRPAPGE